MKWRSWLEVSAIALILSAILWKNPLLFSTQLLFDEESLDNHQLFPVTYRSLSSDKSEPPKSEPVSSFRNDEKRSGFDSQKEITRLTPKKLWSAAGYNLGIHSASKASAALDETGIYIGSDAGTFAHFNWSGKKVWSWWVADHDRGFHSTASLSKSSVFFGAYNGKLIKADKKNGEPEWTTDLADALGASPLLTENALYVVAEYAQRRDAFLAKLDPQTGKILWRTPDIGEQSHSSPALSRENGLLFFGANNGKLFAVNESTGAIVWSYQAKKEIKSTPTIVGDHVCFTDWGAEFTCLNIKNQNVTLKQTLRGFSQVSASYSEKDQRLFVGDSEGYLFAFDTEQMKLLWEKRISQFNTLASPLLFDVKGKLHLIMSCDRTAWCIFEAEILKRVFKSESGARLSGVPVLYEGKLVLSFDYPGSLEVWQL